MVSIGASVSFSDCASAAPADEVSVLPSVVLSVVAAGDSDVTSGGREGDAAEDVPLTSEIATGLIGRESVGMFSVKASVESPVGLEAPSPL